MSDSENRFPFRKPDGSIIWVHFARMMEASFGELTLEDGTVAIRARDLEAATPKPEVVQLRTECVSDSLGFPEKDVKKHQAFLKAKGIKGVEFRRDPTSPGFMQVVCDSQATKLRYARARNPEWGDLNSKNGGSAAIGPREIEQAQELVRREHGDGDQVLFPEECHVG